MLTSDCPGSVELKQMLQEAADRVGAKFAMLVGSDGSLKACSGHHDRFTVECFAGVVTDSDVWRQEIGPTPDQTRVYVDSFTAEEMARLYIRRLTGEHFLVTAFELDDGDVGIGCIGSDSDLPSLNAAAKVRRDVL